MTRASTASPARRRGFWPRSLLGRNLLLVTALIVLGQLVAAVLVRQMVFQPRVAQVADGVARNVAALRAGLGALSPVQRAAFVEAFNRQVDRADEDGDAERTARSPRHILLSPFEQRFVQAVSRRLAEVSPVQTTRPQPLWRRDSAGVMALRVVDEEDGGAGDGYWLSLPNVLPSRAFTGAWLAATLASMLLALLGAWWLQRCINRPLEKVVGVAQQLAHGQAPSSLPEDGPEELASVGRSLNRMAKSLAMADHERALMLAGVSHDLRTPLTKLRLGVEIAGPRLDAPLATSMARSIDEMDGIVGQFLDFARIGESESAVTASLNDLAQAVAQAQADHGRALSLELAALRDLSVRPQALRRAVDNLVENAWRHGAPPVVLRTGAVDGKEAWIEAADHGPGIAPQAMDRMRRPFARGGGVARTGTPGAGLGLAIVERVARSHGGRLELHSPPGQGLRARLVLPLGTNPCPENRPEIA